MADQHHRLGTLGKKLLQPLYTLYIEMVGRLVEKKHIGFLQQYLSQLDTHTPSTRELTGRTVEVLAGEAQTCKRALYLCLIVLAAHHHVAFMLLGKLLYQLGIRLALIVGTVGHLLLHLVETCLHLCVMSKGLAGFLLHGGVVLQLHHLWQIAYRCLVGHSHNAICWFLHTTKYLEHRRLTCSVLAHQGYAVTVVDDKVHIVEERFYAKLDFQAFY